MSDPKVPGKSETWGDRAFRHSETMLYAMVALFLGIGAVVLATHSAISFPSYLQNEGVDQAVLHVLDDLLLVIMLAEIIHTVGISIKSHQLQCEPFLIVGVIAAVRRMLIITAEAAQPTPDEYEKFRLMMLELGILTLMIVALAFGIYLLRRRNNQPNRRDNRDHRSLAPSRLQSEHERDREPKHQPAA